MKQAHAEKVAALIREASNAYILPRFKALKNHEIDTKTNPTDLVTLADIEAEQFFERTLPDLLPGSLVIGEEGVSSGVHELARLEKNNNEVIWVVDPVDGTYNFVHGRDEFGVMVSLVENGICTASWIYDVLKDAMAHAILGDGAYIENISIKIPQNNNNFDELIIHLSPKFFPADIREAIKIKARSMSNVRAVGSAAHEYMKIARGQSDSAVYCRLKPWDHLPGSLIVTEAGGIVSKWDNSPYTPQDRYDGLIVARNEYVWDHVFQTFFGNIDINEYMKSRLERVTKV